MKDILLTENGDLVISAGGDISLTDSVRQAIAVRLRWFWQEWRLGLELGLPYFEEVFVKNPNTLRIEQLMRDEILSVAEVTNVKSVSCKVDGVKRLAFVSYVANAGDEVLREEVRINV